MGYIEDNLLSGEKLLYRTELHKIIYLWPVAFFVAGILLFMSGGEAMPAGLFLVVVALPLAAGKYLQFRTSEFGLTDRRVIIKTGLIQRNTRETQLAKIEAVDVKQGVLGRLLNYGTIIISATGGTKGTYKRIREPLVFKKHVQEAAVE